MKESVLDVLMYLFDSFVDNDDESEPSRRELQSELERAGFHDREIEHALDWLDGLHATTAGSAPQDTAFRVYDADEQERLGAGARGYLLHLEQLDDRSHLPEDRMQMPLMKDARLPDLSPRILGRHEGA